MVKSVGTGPVAQDMALSGDAQALTEQFRSSIPGQLKDAYERGGYIGFNHQLQAIQKQAGILNMLQDFAQTNAISQIETAKETLNK